jgi:hypothetical protein
MNKRKTARVAAFIGAVGASAALIASAVGTTGAYFTDTEAGSVGTSYGHVVLNKASNFNLAFDNLLPGKYQDKTVSYDTVGASDTEDIWLVFDKSNSTYQAITGTNGIGGFGHFAVFNNAGNQLFSSWNLHNDPSTGQSGCANDLGHGGNGRNDDYTYNHNATPANPNDTYCGIPGAIKIESGVPANNARQFQITYGITPRASNAWQSFPSSSLPFKVVATQEGIRPDAQYSSIG